MARYFSRILGFLVCVVSLSFITTYGTAHAAINNCILKLEKVYMIPGGGGTESTGVMVTLRNTTGTTIPGTTWANNQARNFYLYKALGKEGLSIMLTALSDKTKVQVNIGGTALSGSLIMTVAATQIDQ